MPEVSQDEIQDHLAEILAQMETQEEAITTQLASLNAQHRQTLEENKRQLAELEQKIKTREKAQTPDQIPDWVVQGDQNTYKFYAAAKTFQSLNRNQRKKLLTAIKEKYRYDDIVDLWKLMADKKAVKMGPNSDYLQRRLNSCEKTQSRWQNNPFLSDTLFAGLGIVSGMIAGVAIGAGLGQWASGILPMLNTIPSLILIPLAGVSGITVVGMTSREIRNNFIDNCNRKAETYRRFNNQSLSFQTDWASVPGTLSTYTQILENVTQAVTAKKELGHSEENSLPLLYSQKAGLEGQILSLSINPPFEGLELENGQREMTVLAQTFQNHSRIIQEALTCTERTHINLPNDWKSLPIQQLSGAIQSSVITQATHTITTTTKAAAIEVKATVGTGFSP